MRRLPGDVDEARTAYRAKGSSRPVPGRCGARLAKRHGLGSETPWRYCTQAPLHGRTRCRLHGGMSLTGIAHPRFGTGEGTGHRLNPFAAGTALARGYADLQRDEDFLTLKEEMRLLRAREVEVVERLASGSGESAQAWHQMSAAALKVAHAAETPGEEGVADALRTGAAELRALATGSAREDSFRELRAIADLRTRLAETEAKLLDRNRATMTVEQVLAIAGAITGLVSRCIVLARQSEQAALREWAAGVKALTGGLG